MRNRHEWCRTLHLSRQYFGARIRRSFIRPSIAPTGTTMGASIIDSSIFGNIFSTSAMRFVWSDENRTSKYLEIEKALAKVQGELGIIPRAAADEIVSKCDIANIDMDRLRVQT